MRYEWVLYKTSGEKWASDVYILSTKDYLSIESVITYVSITGEFDAEWASDNEGNVYTFCHCFNKWSNLGKRPDSVYSKNYGKMIEKPICC